MNSEQVYIEFQRAKMNFLGKPYFPHRIFPPKTCDSWAVTKAGAKRKIRISDNEDEIKTWMKEHRGKGYRKKKIKGRGMSLDYLAILERLSKRFITRWSEISPYGYFECGFDIYGKSFNYNLFSKSSIMRLYIQRDKAKKQSLHLNKKDIVYSLLFVENFMKAEKITFNQYCKRKYNGHSLPVYHYIKNRIDKYFLVFLIRCGYISLSDNDTSYTPYVVEKFREISFQLEEIETFTNKLKERIENYGTV